MTPLAEPFDPCALRPSPRLEEFRRRRHEIAANPEPLDEIRAALPLAIGALMGGGFMGTAAALSLLTEETYPDVKAWPWNEPGV